MYIKYVFICIKIYILYTYSIILFCCIISIIYLSFDLCFYKDTYINKCFYIYKFLYIYLLYLYCTHAYTHIHTHIHNIYIYLYKYHIEGAVFTNIWCSMYKVQSVDSRNAEKEKTDSMLL